MGHFHGHSDHALQASYHHLVLGVARHSLASGFHPGQASLSLRLRVTGSRPCLSSPVWILGQWSTSQDHTTARTSRSSTLMSPSIGLGGASDFILGTPGLTLVVVTSLPDDDLLGSLALDPRTPGVSPQGQGLRSPLSLSRIAKTIKISIVRTMGP